MKRLLCVVAFMFLCGCVVRHESRTFETETQMECEPCGPTENLIPASMLPETVIEFQDERSFLIKKGGYPELVLNEEIIGLPKPRKGMIVTYANDGYILHIKDANGVDISD